MTRIERIDGDIFWFYQRGATLRLGENESSNSGGGSRKGAKAQRSQREDPGNGWTPQVKS
jgi:hypothetical protein